MQGTINDDASRGTTFTCASATFAHVGKLDLGALDALNVLEDEPHRFALNSVHLKFSKSS
jgi:hypothetical protein